MAIPTSNILSPSAISLPQATRQLLSDLQVLAPHCYKDYVEKYGNEDYTTFISTYSGMEEVKGQEFFHFENRGKLQLAVQNTVAVNAPAAGATVTITIGSADCFNSGTQSPLMAGLTVRLASNGVEGKILTVNKATPNAHTATVRPLRSDKAFAGPTGNLETTEIIQLAGNTEAGESSKALDSELPLDIRYTNWVTQIRADFKSSDLSDMEEVFYTYNEGGEGLYASPSQSAFTYKGLVKTNKRFLNDKEMKLLKGDIQNNTGLNAGTQGTLGVIPTVVARGTNATYTPGSLDIAKLHEITRLLDVNGAAKQCHWLMDIYQSQEFDDTLFSQYPAGAFVWGTGSSSEEASVAYGFKNLYFDAYMFQKKKKADFNTEVPYGKSPLVDQYRNFGLIVPQGEGIDTRTNQRIKNLTVMYEQPRRGGTIANGIKVWEYGANASVPTNDELSHGVSMVAYQGMRVFAANQFLALSGN